MSCEFRLQAAHAPRATQDAARCPACHRIDWFRDGLVLLEREDGTLYGDRVEPRKARSDEWSCMACGYEVPPWSTESRLIAQFAVAARWSFASVR